MAASRDIQKSIKQLLTSVMAAASGSQSKFTSLEDTIANLESTDENFHNYELVKYIYTRMQASIGPLVDKGLNKLGLDSEDEQKMVAAITDEVLTSDEYNELCQNILMEVKDAVNDILASDMSLSQGSSSSTITQVASSTLSSSGVIHHSMDDTIISGDLSSLKDTLMFVPQDQLLDVAYQLSPSNSPQLRLEALEQLKRYPINDLSQCDNWSLVSTHLIDALMSSYAPLANATLKFICHMACLFSSSTVKEACDILSLGLMKHFQDPASAQYDVNLAADTSITLLQRVSLIAMNSSPAVASLSLPILLENLFNSKCSHIRGVHIERLLNHIHINVPLYWIRYNDRISHQIIDITLSLLEVSYDASQENALIPMHYVSLIDPTAVWFHKWTHTQYNRSKVFKQLKLKDKIVDRLIDHVISYRPSHDKGRESHDDLYMSCDVDYLYFIQGISILERLLVYKHGRSLVMHSLQKQTKVSNITGILVMLMKYLLSIESVSSCEDKVAYDPASVIGNVFKELAGGNCSCVELLCQDELIDIILTRLTTTTNNKMSPYLSDVMIYTVAVLASTANGKMFLLTKPKGKYSPSEVIANYVIDNVKDPSLTGVVCSCLFVCQQLYNTCDGLLALSPYKLHLLISKRIKEIESSEDSEKRHMLIDNLLNFASTPKGIDLLNQSGLMFECIQYMYRRYQLKLQVSQCEKFGYGHMVTQISSTSIGMTHLINSGYVTDLIEEVWSLLSGRDNSIYGHSFDPSDRIMYKAVINILNIMSSFTSLLTAVTYETPPKTTPSEISTIIQLLKHLLSQHELLDEEGHLCGLRIISVLITNFNSLLLLDQHLDLTNELITLQNGCRLDNNHYLIDSASIERNRILISINTIGGPSERILPPRKITDSYDWPFYTGAGGEMVPSCYVVLTGYKHVQTSLSDDVKHLKDVKTFVIDLLKNCNEISAGDVASIIIAAVNKSQSSITEISAGSDDGTNEKILKSHPQLSLMMRYCNHIGLNVTADEMIQILLKLSFHASSNDGLAFIDWFAVTVSLILFQSHDRSCDWVWQFLKHFSSQSQSMYIWSSRPYLIPLIDIQPSVDAVSIILLHYIELILQAELPLVYSSFSLSGYTPSQIVQDWMRQYYWNYLDWPQICLYIMAIIVLGIDYQVYFCVSIFKHLETDILKSCQEQDLLIFLKEEPIKDFNISSYASFMSTLHDKYSNNIFKQLNIN